MLIRFITALCLINAITLASASEIRSRLFLETEDGQQPTDLNEAIVWKPISDGLSRFTLRLPEYSIHQALEFQDTAALYYLAEPSDTGLSVTSKDNVVFDFHLRPEITQLHYHHPVSPRYSLRLGARFTERDGSPVLGAKFRLPTGHLSLNQHYIGFSETSLDLFFAHTKLSKKENLEKILSASHISDQKRLSYGWRWFDIMEGTNFLAEIGFDDGDFALGWQVERRFGATTGYLGSFSNTITKNTEAFWGLRFDLQHSSSVTLESGYNLLSNSAQSLSLLRRVSLPRLWKSKFELSNR